MAAVIWRAGSPAPPAVARMVGYKGSPVRSINRVACRKWLRRAPSRMTDGCEARGQSGLKRCRWAPVSRKKEPAPSFSGGGYKAGNRSPWRLDGMVGPIRIAIPACVSGAGGQDAPPPPTPWRALPRGNRMPCPLGPDPDRSGFRERRRAGWQEGREPAGGLAPLRFYGTSRSRRHEGPRPPDHANVSGGGTGPARPPAGRRSLGQPARPRHALPQRPACSVSL